MSMAAIELKLKNKIECVNFDKNSDYHDRYDETKRKYVLLPNTYRSQLHNT